MYGIWWVWRGFLGFGGGCLVSLLGTWLILVLLVFGFPGDLRFLWAGIICISGGLSLGFVTVVVCGWRVGWDCCGGLVVVR